METNKQDHAGNDLAERIEEALAKPQHRFEVQDPFMETTFRLPTAQAAVEKADEIGATRFQHRDADGEIKQVDKVDGQWWVRGDALPPQNAQQAPMKDDQPIASVQEAIDLESMRVIETRALERAEVGREFEADARLAQADAHAFRRIQDPAWQEVAAVEMAASARQYPSYKEGLEKAVPGYPGTAERVYALDADNDEKVAAKDLRKGDDAASMLEEARERESAGQPMESMPGYRMVYNNEPGHAGAEVITPENERITFGGREAIDEFAKENGLSAMDAATLHQMEARADAFRKEPAYPEVTMTLDAGDLERVAAARARDTASAREALGLNSVEPNIEKEQQKLSETQDAQRAAWLKKAEATSAQDVPASKSPGGNQVESDEIFTATQSDIKPAVPPEIEKQYLRVGDKFYHPKNTDLVAFEDKGNKLETKSNSEAIAESMVRIAESRGWDEIKVSGSETFRKEVWLEAASRGMHVKGYSPSEQDKAELAKRLSTAEANKVEKDNKPFRARENEEEAKAPVAETPEKRMAASFAKDSPEEAVKKHPELAGAAAAVAAMDKQAEADGLTPQQRAVVMARVRQNVVNSIERGNIPEVKVKEEVEAKRDAREEKELAR